MQPRQVLIGATGSKFALRASLCTLFFYAQPDNVIQAAVDKINALLESYMGINDSELGNEIFLFPDAVKSTLHILQYLPQSLNFNKL